MPSCSALSLALGEPLHATAPEASAWLLVEQPGPWGRDALVESRLEPRVAAELQRRAKEAGVKALLVKRPGRVRESGRRCYLGSSRQGSAFLEEIRVGEPEDLLRLDLRRLAAGDRPGLGDPIEEPLYLVCTNSRRDACCARLGRPLAAVLAEACPGRVWECSHLGGHRFAANLVCLPHGLCFGRASAAVAAEAERGRIALDAFRGRSSFPPAAQAADRFLRGLEGLLGIDEVVLESHAGDETMLSANGARFRVRVRRDEAEPPRPLSCGDETLERPPVWSLLSVRRVPGRRRP